jgi:hypothetical protein
LKKGEGDENRKSRSQTGHKAKAGVNNAPAKLLR